MFIYARRMYSLNIAWKRTTEVLIAFTAAVPGDVLFLFFDAARWIRFDLIEAIASIFRFHRLGVEIASKQANLIKQHHPKVASRSSRIPLSEFRVLVKHSAELVKKQ